MYSAKKISGFALAATAAAMLSVAPMSASAGAKGKCVGANSCKGHSDCATANSSCKGQNACKGQGFMSLTKAQCDEKGGTFES